MFRFIVLVCLISSSALAFAYTSTNRGLYNAYQKVTYSLRGGKMSFSCEHGLTHFRLVSAYGSRPKLYWLFDAKWVELEDVLYGDTSISFEGMGRYGGVPIEEMELNVDIPLFNSTHNRQVRDYLYKTHKADFADYVYLIDMVNKTMSIKNLELVIDYLAIDARKYQLEQRFITPETAITAEQIRQQRELSAQRDALLQQVIFRYQQSFRVATREGQHQAQSDCYLE